jgi:hypothetical protein
VNETLNYWANRLLPIIEDKQDIKPVYFICSNRVGFEEGTGYMGSSCILKLKPDVKLLMNLNKKEQNIIMIELNL